MTSKDPNRRRLPLATRLELRRHITTITCGFMDELPPLRHHTDPFTRINHKTQRNADLLAYLYTLPPASVDYLAKYKEHITSETI